ncbi:hypothetical protein pipiens_010970 [Culex pipiens pipiens]
MPLGSGRGRANGHLRTNRIYLYHEGDLDSVTDLKLSGIMERYNEALRVARKIFERLQAEKAHPGIGPGRFELKHPMYVKIKFNKNVAPLSGRNARRRTRSVSEHRRTRTVRTRPCGLESNCINRALLEECNPKSYPAGESCKIQCFKRKQYPALEAKRI